MANIDMADNPLVSMDVFTRKYATNCPDCGSQNIERQAFWVEAKGIYPAMWIDENVFKCLERDCGVIWDEDGDP